MTAQWMTIDDVAELLGTTTELVIYYMNSQHLPSHSAGSFTRFNREEVNKWAEDNPRRLVTPPTWNKKLGHQVCRLDSAYFFPSYYWNAPEWFDEVLQGNFHAIPDPLDWHSGEKLALLINGYELAPVIGLGDCGKFANAKSQEASVSGIWAGSAIEPLFPR